MANITISNFLQLSATGLKVANFTDIRATLISQFKELYGSDIDLSTGSADGIFVNNLSLIINNLLKTVSALYHNLDVNSASGPYLDALCALSNVVRKDATFSTASLIVTNNNDSDLILDNTIFVDKAGTEWQYSGTITLGANESSELFVTCKELGPIAAPAGWIYQTLELLNVSVSQPNAANLGTEVESDAELRRRRSQSNSPGGLTVLESLSGSLLSVSGIDDVLIYNNNSGSSMTSKDSSTIAPHSIYVIIKREAGVQVSDEVIGKIIQEKLTPGIQSCASSGTNGTAKSYAYAAGTYASQIIDNVSTVYWKDAIAIAPSIAIEVAPLDFFSTDEFENIANSVMQYVNSYNLSKNLTKNDIIIQTTISDPYFNSRPTFTVVDVTLSNAVNADTFYNYTTFNYTTSGNNYILTLT